MIEGVETVRDALRVGGTGRRTTVCGWVRTFRSGKNVAFASINDGSCHDSLQAVFELGLFDPGDFEGLCTGACVRLTGVLTDSQGREQDRELRAEELELLGPSDSDYPLQKKKHSNEFLRTVPHLRTRSATFTAVFRMRHHLATAIHDFFRDRGFFYVHPPLITSSDCEGAGETFQVTTLPLSSVPLRESGEVDYASDFFRRKAYMTVSAQLEAEPLALALGRVYTFGPTFRADHSDTRLHAAEFWMIEPEMAFFDLEDDMKLMEDCVRFIASRLEELCHAEIAFLSETVEPALASRYDAMLRKKFSRITYSGAMELLGSAQDGFERKVTWGDDLGTEHERYLCETAFDGPVFVTDYPATLKPFYHRLSDDGRTVACADLLAPQVGEIIGGSQREERLEVLAGRMAGAGIDPETYRWYLELRRWGTAPHSGFGLGFERMLMYLSGMSNIRDVLPFPRTYGSMV
ncbi:asparagine--tRNA ligase [Candidatus Fermentibacterales bacterium]|nr:asparagine--tRNA ligase [Candidatus Fermentibacterales bacterium]